MGSGARGDIANGPHFAVFLPYKREDLRQTLKTKTSARNWNGEGKYWEVPLTKTDLALIRDLDAAESDVKVQLRNFEGDPEKYVASQG
jgi:hypothetical protein